MTRVRLAPKAVSDYYALAERLGGGGVVVPGTSFHKCLPTGSCGRRGPGWGATVSVATAREGEPAWRAMSALR